MDLMTRSGKLQTKPENQHSKTQPLSSGFMTRERANSILPTPCPKETARAPSRRGARFARGAGCSDQTHDIDRLARSDSEGRRRHMKPRSRGRESLNVNDLDAPCIRERS